MLPLFACRKIQRIVITTLVLNQRIVVLPALLQGRDLLFFQTLSDQRRALFISQPPRVNHVIVQADIFQPGVQQLFEVAKVPVVFQGLLELVSCQYIHQVAPGWYVFQCRVLVEPASG